MMTTKSSILNNSTYEPKENTGIILDKGKQRNSPALYKRCRFALQDEDIDSKPSTRMSRSRRRTIQNQQNSQNFYTQSTQSHSGNLTWSGIPDPMVHQQPAHPVIQQQQLQQQHHQQQPYPMYHQQMNPMMYQQINPMVQQQNNPIIHQPYQTYPMFPQPPPMPPPMNGHQYMHQPLQYYPMDQQPFQHQMDYNPMEYNPVEYRGYHRSHHVRSLSLDQRQPDLYIRNLNESIHSRKHYHCKKGVVVPRNMILSALELENLQKLDFSSDQDNSADQLPLESHVFQKPLPLARPQIGFENCQMMNSKSFAALEYLNFPTRRRNFRMRRFSDSYRYDFATREVLRFRAPLMIENAEDILERSMISEDGFIRIHDYPVFRPPGGTLYIQRNANPRAKFEDGYHWTEVLHQKSIPTTRGFDMDYRHFYITSSKGTRMSSRFRKETYTAGNLTLVALIGDELTAVELDDAEDLHTFNSNSWPRPSKKSKRISRSLERTRFDWIGLDRPRSKERRRRFTNPEPRYQPPEPILTETEWYTDLLNVCKEMCGGKLVKNLTTYPSLQATLVHPEMTREFEHACQVLSNETLDNDGDIGIRLFYDLTFTIGKFYATILTYTNACYEGSPVLPLAINIHESKFISCHQLFWARIVGDIPALKKYRFPLFIDDGEPAIHLAVRTQAPNLVQLEAWIHRFRDIDQHFRAKGYGREAIRYFKASVSYLLGAQSKQAMHDKFRMEFEYIWPRDFVQYYRDKILPRSGRLGQWALAKVNIHELHFQNPNANPQESFYQSCRHFCGWEALTLSQLIRAYDLLFLYFVSECHSGKSIKRDGAFCIKDVFRPFFFETPSTSLSVVHPSKIGSFVAECYPTKRPTPIPDPLAQYEEFLPLNSILKKEKIVLTPAVKEDDDIEKMLEKVFAEHEKNKLEAALKSKAPDEELDALLSDSLKVFENEKPKIDITQDTLLENIFKSTRNSIAKETSFEKILKQNDYKFDIENLLEKSKPDLTNLEIEDHETLESPVTSPKFMQRQPECLNQLVQNVKHNKDFDDNQLEKLKSSLENLSISTKQDKKDETEVSPEKLVICNPSDPDMAIGYFVPNRPQTLLLTTRISNRTPFFANRRDSLKVNVTEIQNLLKSGKESKQLDGLTQSSNNSKNASDSDTVSNHSSRRPKFSKKTYLKDTVISQPSQSKSFVRDLFRSQAGQNLVNRSQSLIETPSDAGIEIKSSFSDQAIGQWNNLEFEQKAKDNQTNTSTSQDLCLTTRPSPSLSTCSLTTMVPSRGVNLADFDEFSFASENTGPTNTRSYILDNFETDETSSATTLPSFETNLNELSKSTFGDFGDLNQEGCDSVAINNGFPCPEKNNPNRTNGAISKKKSTTNNGLQTTVHEMQNQNTFTTSAPTTAHYSQREIENLNGFTTNSHHQYETIPNGTQNQFSQFKGISTSANGNFDNRFNGDNIISITDRFHQQWDFDENESPSPQASSSSSKILRYLPDETHFDARNQMHPSTTEIAGTQSIFMSNNGSTFMRGSSNDLSLIGGGYYQNEFPEAITTIAPHQSKAIKRWNSNEENVNSHSMRDNLTTVSESVSNLVSVENSNYNHVDSSEHLIAAACLHHTQEIQRWNSGEGDASEFSMNESSLTGSASNLVPMMANNNHRQNDGADRIQITAAHHSEEMQTWISGESDESAHTITQTVSLLTTTAEQTVMPSMKNNVNGIGETALAPSNSSNLARGISGWNPSSTDPGTVLVNKSGLMLWRKVQNYVVVCGGIVNSGNSPNQKTK